jgi:hypothetical protein
MLPDLPQTEIAIVEMTNAVRRSGALHGVKPNPVLAQAARAFALYLATSGKFGHSADGREPHQRTEKHGYRHCLVAENLAWHADSRGFSTQQLAGEIVKGWRESPGHNQNMLLPEATEIGVAVVQAPYRILKFIAVQILARPERDSIKFTIRNVSRNSVRYTIGEEADTVDPSVSVTHERCDIPQLIFEKQSAGPIRILPRDGDLITVSEGAGVLKVDVKAKASPQRW